MIWVEHNWHWNRSVKNTKIYNFSMNLLKMFRGMIIANLQEKIDINQVMETEWVKKYEQFDKKIWNKILWTEKFAKRRTEINKILKIIFKQIDKHFEKNVFNKKRIKKCL